MAYEFENDVKTLKANFMKFIKLHEFFEREIDSIQSSQ